MKLEEEIRKIVDANSGGLFDNEKELIVRAAIDVAKRYVEIDYNKIAQLIIEAGFAYDQYEETVRTLNYHHSLRYDTSINAPDFIKLKPCNFDNFEEEYLKELAEYWVNESEKLKNKHQHLYYDVDSDDYK